jgi:hypothetical protein
MPAARFVTAVTSCGSVTAVKKAGVELKLRSCDAATKPSTVAARIISVVADTLTATAPAMEKELGAPRSAVKAVEKSMAAVLFVLLGPTPKARTGALPRDAV